jgi:hypothetical protein
MDMKHQKSRQVGVTKPQAY